LTVKVRKRIPTPLGPISSEQILHNFLKISILG
jgi:hypothetical protein